MLSGTSIENLAHAMIYFLLIILTILSSVSSQCSSTNKRATETLSVNDTIQTFESPGYRVAYYARMDCRWIFDAGRDDATIVFDIREILMENSRRCAFDSFTFYQGNSTTGTQLSKLCGRLTQNSETSYVTSSGRYALLQMKTDSSRQYAGGQLFYFYAVENSQGACSSVASINATTSLDFITSPGYPASLANGLECSWTITCDPTTVLYLQIEYSDMEYTAACSDQKLVIYDGPSRSDRALLESWCDSKGNFPTQTTIYYTTDNVAHITLRTTTGSSANRHGFKLNFRQNSTAITTTTTPSTTTTDLVQVCSSYPTELEANETARYFRSLNYPNYYPNNLNCFWRITAPIGYAINLTIVDSEMQSSNPCSEADGVVVYDGYSRSSPWLTSFCGTDTPSVESTGRYLYVHFKTDPTVTYRGFSAEYFIVNASIPTCVVPGITGNFTATTTPQNFTSPNYPDNYTSSSVTYWLIQNPNQTQALAIEVIDSQIESSVNCMYDKVRIYKGACTSYPKLGTFCGRDTPTYYHDKGAYTLVEFTTDDTGSYRGFKIKFYLTDAPDDDISVLIITGIVVGSVVGGVALIGGISYGVYKFVKHGKKHAPSRDGSRRSSSSSSSSSSSEGGHYLRERLGRIHSLKKYMYYKY